MVDLSVSSDYAFWKQITRDPDVVFDQLAEGEVSGLHPHPDVLRFRRQLLSRWPDLENTLEPDAEDVAAWPELAEHYVLLTLSYRQLEHLDDILGIARELHLSGFSGVDDGPIVELER